MRTADVPDALAAAFPGRSLLLLDGGTGRELLKLGAPFRQPEWSALALMEAPEYVTRVHRRYIDAGADVITTNSYAVVPFHLGAPRFADQGMALATLAGRLARGAAAAAPHRVWVAGSLPPVCGSYRPDLFDPATARPVLETLRQALEPHVDVWLSETTGSIAEVALTAEVLRGSRLPWWVSFTLEDEHVRSGAARLRSGEAADLGVSAALRQGASGVLFNCCQPEVISDALRAAGEIVEASGARALTGAYANAFGPQTHSATANAGLSELRADLGPPEYLAYAAAWRQQGARILGGCCGVGPEHIALMREKLEG